MSITGVLLAIAGTLVSTWVGWGAYIIYTTERPPYTVLEKLVSNVEIRQYQNQTWIRTSYDSDNSSFRTLASYIFGSNKDKKTIAMTAPVITGQHMAFILPSEMARDNAPEPDGQPIQFISMSARKVATLRFSWITTPERVARKTKFLLKMLQQKGIITKGEPFLMRYNDPWTPPFMRRNEIGIEVTND